jgi:hypothetical protein
LQLPPILLAVPYIHLQIEVLRRPVEFAQSVPVLFVPLFLEVIFYTPRSTAANCGILPSPAFAALVFLAVLVLGAACWVISSGDRSDRVTRMIVARRGDVRHLGPGGSHK